MSKKATAVADRLASMRALVILLAGQAMATMDGSILAVAAPSLRADMHASGAEIQLILTMYTMAFGALVVAGARLGDILGRERAFVYGLAAFTLGSVAGGLAPTPTVLMVARAFQGGAAALMTAQVLSIIQVQFEGERRAQAIGAYSMILALGVAVGQIVGGLLVSSHLTAAAWRAALLVNAPVGALLLAISPHALRPVFPTSIRRLDLAGAALVAAALLAVVMPLSLGREYGWPGWVWPCFAVSATAGYAFVIHERRLQARGELPLFDLCLFRRPEIAAGIFAVLLIMACYSGFLVSLTLHLQGPLGFSALHAGVIFAVYAAGFATASLSWPKLAGVSRTRLVVLGPLLMATALLGVGLFGSHGGWPVAATTPLLFAGGVGHAWGFSPLATRLTTLVDRSRASDLSGLILTADFTGTVLGVASFAGVYLSGAPHNSARSLLRTTALLAATLMITAACAAWALRPATQNPEAAPRRNAPCH